MTPNGLERLVRAVEVLPLRYAPFFDRLAELWDLSVPAVISVLSRAADESAWHRPRLPGLRVIDVQPGPRLVGARVTLTRFAPGARFPLHRHDGPETLFVLEGSYRDRSGREVGPGDFHVMAPGTEHWFRVNKSEPCVAASVQFGFEFTGCLMRVLTRVFG